MKRIAEKFISFFYQHPFFGLGLVGAFFVPALMLCMKLEVKSDFKRLLPQNKPSVVELDRILDKVGGVGVHQIKIGSDDPDKTIEFIEDLVDELRKLPPQYARVIDYQTKDVRSFFENNKYLYMDLEDLKTVHKRLEEKVEYEKLSSNPFFFDLEQKEVKFDISDIEEKYRSQTRDHDRYYKGYLFSDDKKLAIVLVHPSGATTGTQFSKDLVKTISGVVDRLDPQSYHPSMDVTYGGKFLKVLDQYQQLINDIISTLALCLFFVAIVIYLYFRKIRVIFLLAATLTIGSAWAFALAEIFIGSLNSQTAFLGSIIVGNGVNSGIFLISRYLEERRRDKSYMDALAIATQTTYFPTFSAAITTSVAFAALSFSEIKGMSEFGLIGGAGMILCWLASYTFLPAVIHLTEKYLPMHKTTKKVASGWNGIFSWWGRQIKVFNRPIMVVSVIAIVSFSVVSAQFIPHSLEYDFTNLQNEYEKPEKQKIRDRRTKNIFGETLNPMILLLDDVSQADGICKKIMSLEDDLPEEEKTIDTCKRLQDFVPDNQQEKLNTLAQIRNVLADDAVQPFYKKHKEQIQELRKTRDYDVITLQELPDTLQRKYKEADGTLGRIVFVYNKRSANIDNGKKLMQMTDTLTGIKLDDGSSVRISGDYPIFADLLRAIERDGPKVSMLSFLFVALLIILYFRNVKAVAFILGSLCVAVIVLFGLQSIFRIKLNFFNYIALPVTFGIGVDYAVNLYHRYRQEGKGQILHALEKIGGAIILCSMTTIIGYTSLTQGINQALVSFGWLALIGEISCIVGGLIVIPTIFYRWDRYRS